MKKILSSMMLLAAVMIFTACSSDIDYTPSENYVLQVVSANVSFGPNAASGQIEVTADQPVTAESSESWCTTSVNGNIVTVSVTDFADITSRNAEVIITSGERKVSVPVHQDGLSVALEANDNYIIANAGNADSPILIKNKSNCNVRYSTTESWIHVTESADGFEIVVDANNTTDYRRGLFTAEAGTITKTVYIGQWGTEDPSVEGKFLATWIEDEEEYAAQVQIVANPDAENSYLIKGLIDEGDFPLLYNARNGDYYIPAGAFVGTWTYQRTTYYLRSIIDYMDATGEYFDPETISDASNSPHRMSFAWKTDNEANLFFTYVKNSNLGAGYLTTSFFVQAYLAPDSASEDVLAGWLYEFTNLTLVKL